LSAYADRQLAALHRATGASALAQIGGQTLLGERAAISRLRIPGAASAGGGCTLYPAKDGWIALNLARSADRELLPALFKDERFDSLTNAIAAVDSALLVERGRELGLAIAATGEPTRGGDACTATGARREPPARAPLVIDLSALWAGPLAAHLLWLAGASVVKVESRARPDSMRASEPGFYDLLNQGKASVALNFRTDRARLVELLQSADIVIEAARPRALLQLGIDADEIVRRTPGLVWVSITGHGAGEAANWVGFGDDCGVAAGLTDALHRAAGKIAFVGDAIADPLTGLKAARTAWEHWESGRSARFVLSMRTAAAEALAVEQGADVQLLQRSLEHWARASGESFPAVPRRTARPARSFGVDTAAWLAHVRPC
jgi:hypothetical protein